MESNKYFSDSQCGFRKGLSTIDVLLRIDNEIKLAFQNHQVCLVVYIDFKSAFDLVWREGVVYKLIQMGIKGKLLGIISSFLKERLLKVVINGAESEPKETDAGTPQGAVLSPLLFNVMMCDMPMNDDVKLHVYADDVTITCTAESMALAKARLQNYLKLFAKWTVEWGFVLNPEKCVLQYFTRKNCQYPIVRIMNRVVQYQKTHTLLGLILLD